MKIIAAIYCAIKNKPYLCHILIEPAATDKRHKIMRTINQIKSLVKANRLSEKEAIEYIFTLPGDDLISLVVEEPVPDDDYATFGSAYSPMYTVADFTYLVKSLNLNDCIDVEMKQKPVYNKQG